MANGKKISCMGKVSILGPTEGNTKESTKTIKSMELDRTIGLMARLTKDSGSTASNTVRQDSPIQKVGANLVFGKMVNVLNGWMLRVLCGQGVKSLNKLQRVARAA